MGGGGGGGGSGVRGNCVTGLGENCNIWQEN